MIDSQPFLLNWNNLIENKDSMLTHDDNQFNISEFSNIPSDDNTQEIKQQHHETARVITSSTRQLKISNLYNGNCKLHEYKGHDGETAESLMERYDMFVLYNPGYGSLALQESWKETLMMLVNSRKPVLCTAHSKYDMNRDLSILKSNYFQCNVNATATSANQKHDKYDINNNQQPFEYNDESVVYDEDVDTIDSANGSLHEKTTPSQSEAAAANIRWYIKPELNSFHSSKQTYDGKEDEEARVVTTNQYIYCFHLQ